MAVPFRGEAAPLDINSSLEEVLCAEPYRFSFFQAVRVLSRLFRDKSPVGLDANSADEVVRFHAHLSLDFPPSEIVDLKRSADAKHPAHMTVAFMGLTGPSGALPRYYTEMLLRRREKKDDTLRAFLDLFNHRLISLFYRAWEKNRFWTGFERAELFARDKLSADPRRHRSFVLEQRPRMDLFSQCLLDLGGLGHASLRYQITARDELQPRTAIRDEAMRFYAGLLAQQHRSAISLRGLLSDYFAAPVNILQFSGQWLYVEPENQSSLADDGNATLGFNAMVGERMWDLQGKFRVQFGPLGYERFREFLPAGAAFKPLAHLARLYAGQQFDMDVQLILLAAEVPDCQLTDSVEAGAQLGWNTWIRSGDFANDVSDAVFAL